MEDAGLRALPPAVRRAVAEHPLRLDPRAIGYFVDERGEDVAMAVIEGIKA